MLNRRSIMKLGLVAALVVPVGATVGCDTSWIDTAQKDLPVIINITQIVSTAILDASGQGALTPVVSAAVVLSSKALTEALATLEDVLVQLNKTKDATLIAKVDVTLDVVKGHMTEILTLFKQVTNVDLSMYINNALSLALTVLNSIQLLVPAAPTASTRRLGAPQKMVAKVTLIQPDQLKTAYNSICVFNGYSQYQTK